MVKDKWDYAHIYSGAAAGWRCGRVWKRIMGTSPPHRVAETGVEFVANYKTSGDLHRLQLAMGAMYYGHGIHMC